jgi:hypothetical protein
MRIATNNDAAILDAATAYRAAEKALGDHVASGRASWKDETKRDPDVTREWRRRRVELTEAVSRTRIALLSAARA